MLNFNELIKSPIFNKDIYKNKNVKRKLFIDDYFLGYLNKLNVEEIGTTESKSISVIRFSIIFETYASLLEFERYIYNNTQSAKEFIFKVKTEGFDNEYIYENYGIITISKTICHGLELYESILVFMELDDLKKSIEEGAKQINENKIKLNKPLKKIKIEKEEKKCIRKISL